jgi:hypothetical protein
MKLKPSFIKHYLDCDYWHLLSEAERDFYAQFNREYYRGSKPEIHSKEMVKSLNQDRYSRRTDIMNIIGVRTALLDDSSK